MGASYHGTVAKYESERENVSNMKTSEEKKLHQMFGTITMIMAFQLFKWAIVPTRISDWDILFDVQLGLCQTVDPA